MKALATIGFVGLAVVSAVGCSGKTNPDSIEASRATLRRAQSCSDLESMLKADAIYKMNKQIDAAIAQIDKWGTSTRTDYAKGAPMSAGSEANSGSATTSPSTDTGYAASYSDTNTQVKGVDEADIVKTDGKYLYILHGNEFVVAEAWPASALKQSSTFTLEGQPSEMFVAGDKVVVYSQVDGTKIYAAAGITPKSRYSEYGYGGYAEVDVATPNCYGCGGYGYSSNPLTKITVLTLSGTTAQVARESYFEGSYLSSRRMDSHVRTVINGIAHGPAVASYPEFANGVYPQTAADWKTAYEMLRVKNTILLNSSKYTDWVPYQFERTGGAVTASTLACTDFYVPTAGSTAAGLTQISSLNLGALNEVAKNTAILGSADTVYANSSSLYLAGRAWNDPYNGIMFATSGSASTGVAVAPSTGSSGSGTSNSGSSGTEPANPPKSGSGSQGLSTLDEPAILIPSLPSRISFSKTHLHKFDLTADPSLPTYVGSGTVDGQVKNQFSLDEQNNVLRIATTEDVGELVSGQQYYSSTTVNHVYALQNQNGALTKIGDVGELARGERIYSVRSVGNTAYVVTYRQVDPLFAIDFTDPKNLKKLGELKIPGFSEYMHPLEGGYLLTIGQDVDATTNRRLGLSVQIFDVTNPVQPKQLHKLTYSGDQWGSSEAQYNHKAFTYFEDRKLLSFPYYSYSYGKGGTTSTAELLRIDITSGIKKLGAVEHTSFFANAPYLTCGYYNPGVRRSVFMENVLYSISYGGIKANDVDSLALLSSVQLSAPSMDASYGCGGGGGDVREVPPSPPTDAGAPTPAPSDGGSDPAPIDAGAKQ